MDVDNASRYHVVLEGRRVGPYDRRTIVGMRIKQTLSSDHVLIDSHGQQLTVADLLAQRGRDGPSFNPSQSGAFSIVKGTYTAALSGVSGRGMMIPDFRGEMEVRVQSDVLRLAGRCRQLFGARDTRIKIPLALLAMGQAQGSRVDLWLRSATDVVITSESPLQRLSLDLFSPDTARELLAALPPLPAPNAAQSQAANIPASQAFLTWGALVAVVVVIGGVLVALLTRRVF